MQRERYFCSNHQWCSKNLSSKYLKNTCERVDFLLSSRLGIYSFTKKEVIHRGSLRILVAPSAGSFTDSHFKDPSFVKHLLWHQNYFGVDYPPPIFRSTPRPNLPYHPHPIIQGCPIFSILKTPYCPFVKGCTNYVNPP